MLFNFCASPNQAIAAIELRDNVITFFTASTPEKILSMRAFLSFLSSFLGVEYNIKFSQVTDSNIIKAQDKFYHHGISHLKKLTHVHLKFAEEVDLNTLEAVQNGIEVFQDKKYLKKRAALEKAQVREKPLLRIIYHFLKNLIETPKAKPRNMMPLLSENNLKKFAAEAKRAFSKRNDFSTLNIHNFLASETTQHEIPSHAVTPQLLATATCNEVNNLAIEASKTFRQEMTAAGVASVFVAATALLSYCLFNHRRARQIQQEIQHPAQQRITFIIRPHQA